MIGFAKKIGMTRLFIDNSYIPVTALEFTKQDILQRKTIEKDGYEAVQVGAGKRKSKTKSRTGHFKKFLADFDGDFQKVGEFNSINFPADKQTVDISDFVEKDQLDITGNSKGRGFAGVVKRWDFGGQPASHGHDHERAVGSIGGRWPQRVLPGTRMAGRMGGKSSTRRKALIVAVDAEKNLIFVKGSVPGANGQYLKIKNLNKVTAKV